MTPPIRALSQPSQYVYRFGSHGTEGGAGMKHLLGGKGANLAEMCRLGLPVPAGFTISTEACALSTREGSEALLAAIDAEVRAGLAHIEAEMGRRFGDADNPLLLSVRSGARASMPGMMDTILNLGLNDEAVIGLGRKAGDARFAWDSYRRFIQMYGDVVMGLKPTSKDDSDPFEVVIDRVKAQKGVRLDTELDTADLQELVRGFKALIRARIGRDFPTDPWAQLRGAVLAVFESWHNERAVVYRQLNDIPESWGTAVNVQAMVFGNRGEHSATGVAFSRDAATGENLFNGEFLLNAQGEDVVAGIRTPQQITLIGSRRWADLAQVDEAERQARYPSLQERMPEIYQELWRAQALLEQHFKDMQDMEFTIEEGKLWMLQTRSGKRTGAAMVRIAMEMLAQGLIDEPTALLRVNPDRLNDLLHPVFEPEARRVARPIARGLPASPGAATGQVVFFADEAEAWAKGERGDGRADGRAVILVRQETSPEDLRGMSVAQGILTARGGMTSHAAVVARGMGKCCISGAGAVQVDLKARTMRIGALTWHEGDWISLDGATGEVFDGRIPTQAVSEDGLSGDFAALMALADRHRRLAVRANADTPQDARVARRLGATGIGLCRTEHMFFQGDRIRAVREMILADDESGRRKALAQLLPMQRSDFEGLFRAMAGLPVTIRLLDPPLHEFLPHDEAGQQAMARQMRLPVAQVRQRVEALHEFNPMLGHRGCRLGISFPEITEMQARAVFEAALNVQAEGVAEGVAEGRVVEPEVMIPLVGTLREFTLQADQVHRMAAAVFAERGAKVAYRVGSMIETPRAALVADRIAQGAEFFSFGTNDLTQMTLGFSRDDAGSFLPAYLHHGIYERDPFSSIDQEGVGQLVTTAAHQGRQTRPDLSLGVCGEHGGDPASIAFFHRAGLDYVSCSPFRVPVARLAAAQAAVSDVSVA